MSGHDVFERRATSAGAALREAFLVDRPASAPRPPAAGTSLVTQAGPHAARRSRRAAPAAAVLAAAAAVISALVVTAQHSDPVDVLGSGGPREAAVLAPPYLVGSGTLPDAGTHSVQRFPVPFTFSAPRTGSAGPTWWYRTGNEFEIGFGRNGVLLLAPVETYEPDRTWRGQTRLVPAPQDAAGWADWLARTGHVDVTARTDLLIGGARATRFSVVLAALPDAYDGCGGGRRCLAVQPFDDPSVGPGQVGKGPQAGLDSTVVELTVIELDGRAVLALAGGRPDAVDDWLPSMRQLIDSLRFV